LKRAEKIPMRFALQVDEPHRVPGTLRRGGNQFQAERLEPKINLRIHQTARMNGWEFHFSGSDS
jgi:hypothetical protein